MPHETGYSQQVRPEAAAPLPNPSAASFGADFGAQLGRMGETLHRRELGEYTIARKAKADAERSEAFRRAAEYKANILTQRDKLRAEAPPGAVGHAQAVESLMSDQSRKALFEGLTEDSVRSWLTDQMTDFTNRIAVSERDFETGKTAEKTVLDAQAAIDQLVNAADSSADPQAWVEAHRLSQGYVAGLQGIDGNKREQLDRAFAGQIDVARGKRLSREDPAALIALLDAGAFSDTLDPDQRDRLRSGAEVDLRAQVVQAAREEAEAKAQVREEIQTLEEADRQGIALSDEDYAAAAEKAAAMGDTSTALKIDGLRANATFAKVWGPDNATPFERDQRMAYLSGKKRTAAEDRELTYLQDKAPGWNSAYFSDPTGAAARSGGAGAPPPIDFAEPATLAARAKWAEARDLPVLTRTEAKSLEQKYDTGKRSDQVEVLALLARMPPRQAAEAARMIDPKDAGLAVMAVLPAEYQGLALDGRAAIKADRSVLKFEDADNEERVSQYDARFQQALRNVPPAERQAILATGARIYAGLRDRSGGEESATAYWKAMNMALGARGNGPGQRGGLGLWGENWFMLPDNVGSAAFGRAIAAELRDGANKPVNPDGSQANLRAAFPVMVGDGTYQFHTRGGAVVQGSAGGPWEVRVRSAE